MNKRPDCISFGDTSLTLDGNPSIIGQKAPDFKAIKNDLSDFHLSDLKGQNILISVVPSIDTNVCSEQTKRFNEEANALENIIMLTISCDLPFAQGRFCNSDNIECLTLLSDHRTLDFGKNYGFLIKELRLLARGIVIIDRQGIIRHVEYVPLIAEHPDYAQALTIAKSLT